MSVNEALLTTAATARCQHCQRHRSINIVAESFRAYLEGTVHIQEAFPSLSVNDRELLMQVARRKRGEFHWYLCPACWEEMGEA